MRHLGGRQCEHSRWLSPWCCTVYQLALDAPLDTISRKMNEYEGGSSLSPVSLASIPFLRLPHPRTGPFFAHRQVPLSETCT